MFYYNPVLVYLHPRSFTSPYCYDSDAFLYSLKFMYEMIGSNYAWRIPSSTYSVIYYCHRILVDVF